LWQEEERFFSGDEVEVKEGILTAHACFLIKHANHREEPVREMADSLLSQLKNKFPPVCHILAASFSIDHSVCLLIGLSHYFMAFQFLMFFFSVENIEQDT